tara:strand:+ start:43260 stop:43724 length:465 start_codon:yes stop_codon:yes gene_type:complete
MKRISITLGYLLAVSLFVSCQPTNEQQTGETKEAENKKGNFTNPNEDSELTLLMRDVFNKTERIKKAIEQNQPLPDWYSNYIDDLKKIHSATPTDPEIKESTFFAFVDLLNQNALDLKQYPDKEHYTQLVNSCVKCHQTYCPGPIVRIKKLYVK